LERTSGALFVGASRGKVDVRIFDSIFVDNGATKRNGAVVSIFPLKNHSGHADIVNTFFINKKGSQSTAMKIIAKYDIKLFNVTTSRYWVTGGGRPLPRLTLSYDTNPLQWTTFTFLNLALSL